MYQRTKPSTQRDAPSAFSKGLPLYQGTYLSVRKSASEKGLSSLTRGREYDGITPSFCNVASSVAPRIGPPLSEWITSVPGFTPATSHARASSTAA